MKKLVLILKKKQTHLEALAKILAHEQQLLCAGLIDNLSLQKITEKKRMLLETLSHLDRYRLNEESLLGLKSPYSDSPTLNKEWNKIQYIITSLGTMNMHNGRLLEQHIDHNSNALAIFRMRHQVSLYGPDGRSHKLNSARKATIS